MKPKTNSKSNKPGFTLVEMMVVIAIILILAGILIPVIMNAKTKARVASAKNDMEVLRQAIMSYQRDHSRWPFPRGYPTNHFDNVQHSAFDKTYGWVGQSGRHYDNSILLKILMDEKLPNSATDLNKKGSYIQPKESDDPALEGLPGMSGSRRYHDPFGNEYKVSLDFNGDGVCCDMFYGRPAISKTASIGLVNRRTGKNNLGPEVYVLKGEVMIWTFGPDKLYTNTVDAVTGPNADNIMSWR